MIHNSKKYDNDEIFSPPCTVPQRSNLGPATLTPSMIESQHPTLDEHHRNMRWIRKVNIQIFATV